MKDENKLKCFFCGIELLGFDGTWRDVNGFRDCKMSPTETHLPLKDDLEKIERRRNHDT